MGQDGSHICRDRLGRDRRADPDVVHVDCPEEAGGAVVMRRKEKRFDRPWRFYRRLNSVLEPARAMNPQRMREFERRKTSLIEELISRGSAGRRLRPSGRVALEWARLTVETSN